jgi:membrane associated rhomboid family serine protease
MTLLLIAITCIFSYLAFQNDTLMLRYQFNAYDIKYKKQWGRFLIHGFLHADFMHLLFNMFVLFNFGEVIEREFLFKSGLNGYLYYALLYFGGIFFSILNTFFKNQHNPNYNAVGASGAVSAVMFSFILLNPLDELCLYGIICLKGFWWALFYLVYSYYKANKADDNINHDAHFWGAMYGILFTLALYPNSIVNLFKNIFSIIN